MELGLLERSIMRPPGRRASAARFSEVGGHCQRAASKDQRNRARVPPLYPLTRARGAARIPLKRADLSAVGQQRDPLAPAAGRRSHIVLAESASGRTLELGRSRRSIMRPAGPPGDRSAVQRATGSSPTRGIERSAP